MARQVAEKVTSRFFTILLYEKESAVLVLSFVILIGVRNETLANPVQSLCKPRAVSSLFAHCRGAAKLLLVRAQVKNFVTLCKANPPFYLHGVEIGCIVFFRYRGRLSSLPYFLLSF
jgi:hypothetical protein